MQPSRISSRGIPSSGSPDQCEAQELAKKLRGNIFRGLGRTIFNLGGPQIMNFPRRLALRRWLAILAQSRPRLGGLVLGDEYGLWHSSFSFSWELLRIGVLGAALPCPLG